MPAPSCGSVQHSYSAAVHKQGLRQAKRYSLTVYIVSKPTRVIGTTEEALLRAEVSLGRTLPQSFRAWLKQNNGKGIEDVTVFPVLDDRDPRKTWDSIVRQFGQWQSYCEDAFGSHGKFQSLLPFASFGTGDYYCFDYSRPGPSGEPSVVHWSHETGDTTSRGESFDAFVKLLAAGEFQHD